MPRRLLSRRFDSPPAALNYTSQLREFLLRLDAAALRIFTDLHRSERPSIFNTSSEKLGCAWLCRLEEAIIAIMKSILQSSAQHFARMSPSVLNNHLSNVLSHWPSNATWSNLLFVAAVGLCLLCAFVNVSPYLDEEHKKDVERKRIFPGSFLGRWLGKQNNIEKRQAATPCAESGYGHEPLKKSGHDDIDDERNLCVRNPQDEALDLMTWSGRGWSEPPESAKENLDWCPSEEENAFSSRLLTAARSVVGHLRRRDPKHEEDESAEKGPVLDTKDRSKVDRNEERKERVVAWMAEVSRAAEASSDAMVADVVGADADDEESPSSFSMRRSGSVRGLNKQCQLLAEEKNPNHLPLEQSGNEEISGKDWVKNSQSSLEGATNGEDGVFIARRDRNPKEGTAAWKKKERRRVFLEEKRKMKELQ